MLSTSNAKMGCYQNGKVGLGEQRYLRQLTALLCLNLEELTLQYRRYSKIVRLYINEPKYSYFFLMFEELCLSYYKTTLA